jgi:hypothetical protein
MATITPMDADALFEVAYRTKTSHRLGDFAFSPTLTPFKEGDTRVKVVMTQQKKGGNKRVHRLSTPDHHTVNGVKRAMLAAALEGLKGGVEIRKPREVIDLLSKVKGGLVEYAGLAPPNAPSISIEGHDITIAGLTAALLTCEEDVLEQLGLIRRGQTEVVEHIIAQNAKGILAALIGHCKSEAGRHAFHTALATAAGPRDLEVPGYITLIAIYLGLDAATISRSCARTARALVQAWQRRHQ